MFSYCFMLQGIDDSAPAQEEPEAEATDTVMTDQENMRLEKLRQFQDEVSDNECTYTDVY
jgi:hypothetical protein